MAFSPIFMLSILITFVLLRGEIVSGLTAGR